MEKQNQQTFLPLVFYILKNVLYLYPDYQLIKNHCIIWIEITIFLEI